MDTTGGSEEGKGPKEEFFEASFFAAWFLALIRFFFDFTLLRRLSKLGSLKSFQWRLIKSITSTGPGDLVIQKSLTWSKMVLNDLKFKDLTTSALINISSFALLTPYPLAQKQCWVGVELPETVGSPGSLDIIQSQRSVRLSWFISNNPLGYQSYNLIIEITSASLVCNTYQVMLSKTVSIETFSSSTLGEVTQAGSPLLKDILSMS